MVGCEADRNVAVFWDYENCEIPSSSDGYSVAVGVRNLVEKFGTVKLFKAYLESGRQSNLTPRLELISSGVDIIDCPHNGKKDVVDMTLIVDMLIHALDNPSSMTTIVLISGDGDYMRALASLRNRKYHTIVITPRDCSHSALKYQAFSTYDWYSDVIAPMQRQGLNSARTTTIPKHANVQGRSAPPQVQQPTPPASGVEPASGLPTIKVNTLPQAQREQVETAATDEKKSPEVDAQNSDEDNAPMTPSKSPAHKAFGFAIEEPRVSQLTTWSTVANRRPPLPSAGGSDTPPQVSPERHKSSEWSNWSFLQKCATSAESGALSWAEEEKDTANDKLYSEVAASVEQTNVNIVASTTTDPLADQLANSLNPDIVIPSVAMYHNKKPAREFKALVKVMEAQRLQGSTRVVSSVLGSALLKEDESVYRRAQVSKLKDYLLLAQKAGVVILGREDLKENGNRWIALHPEYHGYGRRPVVVPSN